MNSIIIGDIHGSRFWKKTVEDNPNCRYVFLGDYLDPFENMDNNELTDNLKEIIQLKKDNPDNVVLLLGNHDMHYITSDMCPSLRFDLSIYEKANELFIHNFHLFHYAYQIESCIFTHAGISHEWFVNDFQGDITNDIAEQLNNPTEEQAKSLCLISEFFGGEEGTIGGIFFAHLQDLYEPLHGFTQIVGHNRMDEISEYQCEHGNVIFCDALWNGQYLKMNEKEEKEIVILKNSNV
ncbi:MAG: metallophosphoesterase [Bacteroidales bacterium]|jgi:hypothetical protein|nr:metallophosphoesterase [Bacteroidales bacterium]